MDPPLYRADQLVLREPKLLREWLLGSYLVLSSIGIPLALWIGVLHGVALRCERAAPGSEPACVVEYDYGLLETERPVPSGEVREARAELRTDRRSKTTRCLSLIPRRDDPSGVVFARSTDTHVCDDHVAAVRAFFASPAAPALRIDDDDTSSLYVLLVLPICLLSLVSGLFHFETRILTLRRDTARLVVRERTLQHAFLLRTVEDIPFADIREFDTGSSLRNTELRVWRNRGPRVDLWRSRDKQATQAAVHLLTDFIRE